MNNNAAILIQVSETSCQVHKFCLSYFSVSKMATQVEISGEQQKFFIEKPSQRKSIQPDVKLL